MREKHQGNFDLTLPAAKRVLDAITPWDDNFPIQVAIRAPAGCHQSGLRIMSIEEFNRQAFMGLIDLCTDGVHWIYFDPAKESGHNESRHLIGSDHFTRHHTDCVMVLDMTRSSDVEYFNRLDSVYKKRGHVNELAFTH